MKVSGDFSVLMSIYNNDDPSELLQSIDSVLNSSIVPKEFRVVVDGPINSNLSRILDSFSNNECLKIQYLDQNVGLGNALNKGLLQCEFEYVARMDSDDICSEVRFERQLAVMENYDIVGGYISEFDLEPESPYSMRKVPLTDTDIKEFGRRRCPFNHVTVMYRRSVVLENGGYVGGKNFQEDYYLWIRMLNSGSRALNLPIILVNVRAGQDMLYRRGGLDYALKEMSVQYKAFKIGYIGLYELVRNCSIRFLSRISPIFIKKLIYSKLR